MRSYREQAAAKSVCGSPFLYGFSCLLRNKEQQNPIL